MTRIRFIHKAQKSQQLRDRARKAISARWEKNRADQEPILAAIAAENLPRNPGDMIGALQWTDAATGKTRRWVVRMAKRRGQITLEAPGGKPTKPHGWTWAMTRLRSAIVKSH